MAKKGKRRIITLECTLTGHRTYATTKNVENTPDRLEIKKYNPLLRRYTLYKEVKV